MERNYVKQVMLDALAKEPSAKYEEASPDDVLRNALYEALGTKNPTAMDLKSYKMQDFYAVMSEVVGNEVSDTLEREFAFAEYANVALGDLRDFELMSPELFDVGITAKGNGDIEVQRITNGHVRISTDQMAIRFAVPFMRWASGRTDFEWLKNKVVNSYVNKVRELIYKAYMTTATYNDDANFNIADTSGLDATNINKLADRVSGANGNVPVVIMASKAFIRSYAGQNALSDRALDEIRENGYVTMSDGNILMPMAPVLDADDNFVFDDATAIIEPLNGDKAVKIVEEGTTLIDEIVNTEGNMAKQHTFIKMIGVGVASATKRGRYTFTG
jgi:hypothetical protein